MYLILVNWKLFDSHKDKAIHKAIHEAICGFVLFDSQTFYTYVAVYIRIPALRVGVWFLKLFYRRDKYLYY